MINVLYDCSSLGIAHRNRWTFGISRTTEQLLNQLLECPDLSMFAGSDFSFGVWLYSRLYLKSRKLNERVPWRSNSINVTIRNQVKTHLLSESLFAQFIQKLKAYKIIENEVPLYQWRAKVLEFGFQGTAQRDLNNLDIYHSSYYAIPAIVKQRKSVKPVLTVHDIIPILHPEWCGLLKDGDREYFHPEADLPTTLKGINRNFWISCPSEATRQDLCTYLGNQVNPEQVKVVPWAASDRFYPCQDREQIKAAQATYGIPTDRPYILSLSTLEPRKNLDGLIRSFLQLITQEKIEDLVLVLSGRLGWDYQPILAAARQYPQLTDRIIFTGYLRDQDLAPIYSGAVAFVYPSFYEGFGLPPLEAMQCGTPVITSNRSSLPEVVGNAALLADPNNLDDLSQSLLAIYRSPSLRNDLSRRSLQQAQQFSWQSSAQKTVELYQQALS
ncbi:glycosyltransferase family 4 protein [Limnothrix sp. FACHB-881]|uniref:glycosyltransferase family 4 protein n=1 Tax=Limnothrix sp. FACHB-881 TaxID=2692819 RepID=UPI00168414C4|nr:glycosyltransferase family 1 protein [Limnothrix sp. FACHB-881]MBD2634469.1 glycosyltransferase family 4 protein [Limnothrix sp. FACHB-881]